ncbi:helix-turn-helix transcriptional regulator [Streptomyces sp. HNM0575]|uniref:TetR family transcriptional regulator n=1 Tax=Streptomyces sp. HNM0575 TaxID=2716338 RepID=UPI00145D5DEB|nr:helix-turn-helix transcriptional regulator [Streptomyces sp. HNM0575]
MSARRDIPRSPRRKYESPSRAERAARTRRAILTAAEELFTERGLAETSVAAIAERAGVAQPTVYAAFGSKAGLLRRLLSGLEARAGAEEWRARLHSGIGPAARLTVFAQWSRHLYSCGAGLIRAAYRGAGDPAVTELHEEGNRRRRRSLSELIDSLRDEDALPPGLPAREAVDRAFVLTGPQLYLSCVDDCGWTDDAYETWLAGLLVAQLLSPAAARATERRGQPRTSGQGRSRSRKGGRRP